jgi:hypothetical protein
VESQYSNEQKELLAERLSAIEVSELLERLGNASLGGPEESTVGAVIEATGASPLEVGRLLAEIRQENLERRFSETFDDHEDRIERLELTGVRKTQMREFDPEKRQILEELAAVEQRKRFRRAIGCRLDPSCPSGDRRLSCKHHPIWREDSSDWLWDDRSSHRSGDEPNNGRRVPRDRTQWHEPRSNA